MPWSIFLCDSSSSAESKILSQRLQRTCFGVLEPAAAVDMPTLGSHTLLRVILPAKGLMWSPCQDLSCISCPACPLSTSPTSLTCRLLQKSRRTSCTWHWINHSPCSLQPPRPQGDLDQEHRDHVRKHDYAKRNGSHDDFFVCGCIGVRFA